MLMYGSIMGVNVGPVGGGLVGWGHAINRIKNKE
jgi:hypothetical protein